MLYFYLMATSMGLQQLKTWQDNKQKKALAEKQMEFRKAMQVHDFDRCRKLQAEAAKIALEMEAEAHAQRRKDIEHDYDKAYETLIEQFQLDKWPLNVVPFIMKGESFGSHVRGFDAAAVQCILTPSNDINFNRFVYNSLDMHVEQMMNSHWNSNTKHQVVYYGGSWKPKAPNGVATLDYNDVVKLNVELRSIPVICITPYFNPNGNLIFRVWVWGMGTENTSRKELLPLEKYFRVPLNISSFNKPKDKASEDNFNSSMNLFIQDASKYLTVLIGFLADIYYWQMYKTIPLLPRLTQTQNLTSIEFITEDYCRSAYNPNANISDFLNYGLSLIDSAHDHNRKLILDSVINSIAKYIGIQDTKELSLSDLIIEGNLMMWINENEKKLLHEIIYSSHTPHYFQNNKSQPIKKRTTKMNAEQYSHNKDVLLDILSDILKIEMLPKSHRTEFEHISRKINEDQFSIALIGEFQGGKSTTFDALCDGREISPRGNNIKTSACRIRTTNISEETKEFALITWKSDSELIQTISSVLTTIPPEYFVTSEDSQREEQADNTQDFSYTEYIQLSNPYHRSIILENLNHLEGERISDETRDIILIAKLILANYEEAKKIREETNFPIAEAMQYVVFPNNMVERYDSGKHDVSCFEFAESLFAFVETVDCYIHSKALKRLGCTFVDCPGLFASDYDTSIAVQTMCSSDATLYLLGGEKQMGQEDKKAIREIMKIGRTGNKDYIGEDVFFTINQRKPLDQTSFIGLDLSEINQIGFKKDKLPLYNALLFYYAQIGQSFLDGSLDDITLKKFMNRAKEGVSFSQRWIRRVNDAILKITDVDSDEDLTVNNLSYESVEAVRSLSQSKALFSSIEDYIVEKKAHSILIDNGAKKVQNGLSAIEASLEAKEKSAQTDVATKAAEFQHARQEYDIFLAEADDLISSAFPKKEYTIYVKDSYKDYFLDESVVSEIAFTTTVNLIDYMKKGSTKWRSLKHLTGGGTLSKEKKKQYEAEFKEDITVLFTEAFKATITPVITKWITTLYAGNDFRFDTIRERARELGKTIQDRWKQLSTEIPLLNELSLPNIEDQIPQCTNQDVTFDNHNISAGMVDHTSQLAVGDALDEIIAQIVSFVTYWVVVSILDVYITFGFAIIIGIIMEILVYYGWRNPKEYHSVSDFKKKELALYNELKDRIRYALSQEQTYEQVCFNQEKGMIKTVNTILNGYKSFYMNELKSKEHELESAIKEQEKLYNGTRENLVKIAAEAKIVRKEKIQPLIKKIDSFVKKVENDQ